MVNYTKIYDEMEFNWWYTAADLFVTASSMNAMVRRGLVEKRLTTPRTYRKIETSKIVKILEYAKKENKEFFTLFNKDTKLGMLCSVKNSTIVDCWGKAYDVSKVDRMCIYDKGLKAEYVFDN